MEVVELIEHRQIHLHYHHLLPHHKVVVIVAVVVYDYYRCFEHYLHEPSDMLAPLP